MDKGLLKLRVFEAVGDATSKIIYVRKTLYEFSSRNMTGYFFRYAVLLYFCLSVFSFSVILTRFRYLSVLTLRIGCLESLDWTHPNRIKCLFRCRTVLIQAVTLLKVAPTFQCFFVWLPEFYGLVFTLCFWLLKEKRQNSILVLVFNSLSEPNVIVGCSLAALLIFHWSVVVQSSE